MPAVPLPTAATSRPRARLYVAGVLLAILALLPLARRNYQLQQEAVTTAAEENLEEVAALAAERVSAWRAERLADAAVTAANLPLTESFARILDGTGSSTDRDRALAWMAAMREHYRYANAVLLDPRGEIRLQSGTLSARADQYTAFVKESQRVERDLVDTPGTAASDRPSFTLVVGLRSLQGAWFGTLLLGIDPSDQLYASILTWPSSRTGQVALVRRDGSAVRFLSPLRGVANDGPDTGVPSPNSRASALERVGAGERLVDGDVRGVRVMAAGADVPGSPWRLVAAIDHEEANAPMTLAFDRFRFNSTLFVLFVVVAAGTAYGYQLSIDKRQQRTSERERRELQRHYAFLTSFGNDAILLVDVDDRIVEMNDRALEWFGYARAEMAGLKVSQLQTSEAAGDFVGIRRTLRAQGRLVFQTLARRRDGTTLPVEISARLIEIDDQPFSQWILRDITERQRADSQIRRLNRLYAVLSGCSRVVVEARTEIELFEGVCRTAVAAGGFRLASIDLIEADGTTLTPAARAGVTAGEVDRIAQATEERLRAGAADRAPGARRLVVCNDILADSAMEPWHAEAARLGLRSSIALPLRRGEQEIGVLALYTGETGFFDQAEATLAEEVADSVSFALDSLAQDGRRRTAEEELRRSNERLERVLDATNEGYWDWRPDAELHLSARYHTMLGYEPGELSPGFDAWLEMVHPDDRAAVQAQFAHFMSSRQETFAAEYRMKRKLGDYIWVLSRAKAVERDAKGVPSRLVGTNTDITESKRLEEQFLQAQKLESVGRLAGGVAHDFNNLLTVVNGYSEILLDNLDVGDPNWSHVDTIRQAGERASAMTRQLLAFSRKQTTLPRALHLNDLVREFERMVRRMVGEDVELILRLAARDDRIKADPVHLEQVMMNLLVNARDAMPSGGRILVQTSEAILSANTSDGAAPGPYVVLTVTDSGTGIDEETRARLFEPFFTTKEKGRGTGLGLSTVYGIVRQAGGFIRVDSRLGEGTSFAILWPQLREAADRVPAARAVDRPLTGSETVLVVEDLPPVRMLAIRALSAKGYATIAAGSGSEALRLAAAHDGPIHVLLTDVVMPGLDGPTLAARLAELRPGIKVIFTSGYTDVELGQRGLLDSGFAYLPKPFTPTSLSAKIREVLGGVTPAGTT